MTYSSDNWTCENCNSPLDFEPQMCCSGADCGCRGMPVDPMVCSIDCYNVLYGNSNKVKHSITTFVETNKTQNYIMIENEQLVHKLSIALNMFNSLDLYDPDILDAIKSAIYLLRRRNPFNEPPPINVRVVFQYKDKNGIYHESSGHWDGKHYIVTTGNLIHNNTESIVPMNWRPAFDDII